MNVVTFTAMDDSVESDGTTFEARPVAPPRDGPAAWVAVFAGADSTLVAMREGAPMTMGRSRASEIRIADKAASRLHATLLWDGGERVRITDHGSRNGTYVDGGRLEGERNLGSGAEIRVGEVRMIVRIQRGPSEPDAAEELVAVDPSMLKVIELARRAAQSEVTVLLLGETGSGKEVIARYIHSRSTRSDHPLVAVNCGSIADSLAESSLFGHEKGAFTGAESQATGYFEAAVGGTLFLDEVGELTLSTQTKLLRALEERVIVRVGGTTPVPVDVRIVAATNRDLGAAVKDKSFRNDLFYRLNVLTIEVPPLRQRPEDIEPLARRLIAELSPEPVELTPDAFDALRSHRWPGNVRQLRNVLARSLAVRRRDRLATDDLIGLASDDERAPGVLSHHMRDAERVAVERALEECGGNQTRAAKRLGISRRAFIYKLEKFGLKPPPKKKS